MLLVCACACVCFQPLTPPPKQRQVQPTQQSLTSLPPFPPSLPHSCLSPFHTVLIFSAHVRGDNDEKINCQVLQMTIFSLGWIIFSSSADQTDRWESMGQCSRNHKTGGVQLAFPFFWHQLIHFDSVPTLKGTNFSTGGTTCCFYVKCESVTKITCLSSTSYPQVWQGCKKLSHSHIWATGWCSWTLFSFLITQF